LQFQAQTGDGIWYSTGFFNTVNGGYGQTSTTTNGLYQAGTGGYSQIRIYCSTYTSGTINITVNAAEGNLINFATDINDNMQVVGNTAAGSADSGNGVKVSGVYNSTLPSLSSGQRGDLQLDSSSRVILSPSSVISSVPSFGILSTYSAATLGLSVATTPTDIFTITGSATKTIYVTKIRVSGTQTNPGQFDFQLIKRSSTNTGGTSTTPTGVPHDSNNAAATATVRAYTANPSALGTAIGTVRAEKVTIPAIGSGGATGLNAYVEWNFGIEDPGQPIVLRGTSQVLALNFNAVTIGGSSLDMFIEWIEE
jgi:hypothetical protein